MTDANKKLVNLYYNIGKMLEENSSWGNKFIDNVAMDLKMSFPNLKEFSVHNLKYMKTFYNEYKNDEEFVQLVAQIPWKLTAIESKNFLVENFDQKNIETRGGRFKNQRVFTEQGVAMLATVLKSKIVSSLIYKYGNFILNYNILCYNICR